MSTTEIRESPTIEIECGQVRGRTYVFRGSHSAASFLGIPFAESPVGELRFQRPQPIAASWSGRIRDCTQFGAYCPMISPIGAEHLPQPPQSENNLLCLNVFAPVDLQNRPKSNLAVLFYIHAGDLTICRYLCAKDLVVVTCNYRLGLYGFLSTGDSTVPSNLGLWDQTAALEWVKRNIHQFGGDANNITVSGHSAGAASSDLLNLSPHSRDLFHKIAPLGGSSFCGWATESAETIRKRALDLAKRRGFQAVNDENTKENNRQLVEFLRRLPTDELAISFVGMPLPQNKNAIGMHVAPVFDGDFFPRSFDELRKEAPLKPILSGITKYEGLIFTASGEDGLEKAIAQFLQMYVPKNQLQQKLKEISDQFLLTQPEANAETRIKRLLNIISDLFISFGVWQMAESYVQHGNNNVYLYTFDYIKKGGTGVMGRLFPFEAASHGTEMPYFLGVTPIADFTSTAEDEKLTDRFTTYLANFAKYGNPNGKSDLATWLPLTSSNLLRHNVIRLETDELREDFCDGRPLKLQKSFFQPKI
ncbi:Carboxylic ester hydrolase [Aphelenchoides besseyi]|nr:Carboxylic ester hydrolase [Aphelenchoides besseyi]